MKTILTLAFAFPFFALASADTTIDLGKFSALAEAEIEAAYGVQRLDKNSAEIFFIDGAGSRLQNPTVDLAHLVYLAKVKVDSPEQTHVVAFRLLLGQLNVRRANVSESRIAYAIAGSAMVTLKENSPEKMQELHDVIMQLAPEASVQSLGAVGIILFDCLPKNAVTIENYFRQHRNVVAVETNSEGFGMDAAFAPMQKLSSKALKVDIDSLRTLTRELMNSGVVFEPAATVPENLR